MDKKILLMVTTCQQTSSVLNPLCQTHTSYYFGICTNASKFMEAIKSICDVCVAPLPEPFLSRKAPHVHPFKLLKLYIKKVLSNCILQKAQLPLQFIIGRHGVEVNGAPFHLGRYGKSCILSPDMKDLGNILLGRTT